MNLSIPSGAVHPGPLNSQGASGAQTSHLLGERVNLLLHAIQGKAILNQLLLDCNDLSPESPAALDMQDGPDNTQGQHDAKHGGKNDND